MKIDRREFLWTSAIGLTGAAACTGERGAPQATSGQSNGNTLELRFSGLYGFVFSGTPLALDVFLVDAAQTTSMKDHPHQARLRTDAGNVHDENDHKGMECKIDFKTVHSCWDISGYHVAIEPTKPSPVMKRDGSPAPKGKVPENAAEQAHTFWLPSMERILGEGKGRINPACFDSDPSTAKVASRVRLTTGLAFSRFRPPYQAVVWQIAKSESGVIERAMGELTLTMPLTSDKVTFDLKRFAGGGQGPGIVLRRHPDKPTIVEILNEPVNDQCKTDKDVQNLEHFSAFYELLAPPNNTTTGPIPVCAEPCEAKCTNRLTQDTYCPGAEYGGP